MTNPERARSCPRCQTPLSPGRYRDIPMGRCTSCQGSLVVRHDLPRLLQWLAGDLSADAAELDRPLRAVPPTGGLSCPGCRLPMEGFRYLEAVTVQPNACRPCEILWLSAPELSAMCRLYARTERQASVLEQELADIQTDSVERFVAGSDPATLQAREDRDVARLMQALGRLYAPAALWAELAVLGTRLVASQPLPAWLRLAEPKKRGPP